MPKLWISICNIAQHVNLHFLEQRTAAMLNSTWDGRERQIEWLKRIIETYRSQLSAYRESSKQIINEHNFIMFLMNKLDPDSNGRLRRKLEDDAKQHMKNTRTRYALSDLIRSCILFYADEELFGRFDHQGRGYHQGYPHARKVEQQTARGNLQTNTKHYSNLPKQDKLDEEKKRKRRCYHCGILGHYAKDCRKKQKGVAKISREKYEKLVNDDKQRQMKSQNSENLGKTEILEESDWPKSNSKSSFQKSHSYANNLYTNDNTNNNNNSTINTNNDKHSHEQHNHNRINSQSERSEAKAHRVHFFDQQQTNPYDFFDPKDYHTDNYDRPQARSAVC